MEIIIQLPFGHGSSKALDYLQEVVAALLDVVDELERLDWSLGGCGGACDQQGKCNLQSYSDKLI